MSQTAPPQNQVMLDATKAPYSMQFYICQLGWQPTNAVHPPLVAPGWYWSRVNRIFTVSYHSETLSYHQLPMTTWLNLEKLDASR